MITYAKENILFLCVLASAIVTLIIILYLIGKSYRKRFKVEDSIKFKVNLDDIFAPLKWKFTQMHTIAKTMINSLEYTLMIYNGKKAIGSEILTLSILENIVEKDYVKNWDRKTKSHQYKLFMIRIVKLLKKGCVTFIKNNIKKEIDNARDEHCFFMAFTTDFRHIKKVMFVPFTGYETELSRNVLMISILCDENKRIIGVCCVGNEADIEIIQNIA